MSASRSSPNWINCSKRRSPPKPVSNARVTSFRAPPLAFPSERTASAVRFSFGRKAIPLDLLVERRLADLQPVGGHGHCAARLLQRLRNHRPLELLDAFLQRLRRRIRIGVRRAGQSLGDAE